MEGADVDDDHVDIDESCQPRVNKKLKKEDNTLDDDRLDQSQEDEFEVDKNPFEIPVILDVVFKMLGFEDVKKFRLVSSTWNNVGTSELSRRPQKPIKFDSREELDDNKLDAFIQLKRSHNEVFSGYQHQLFTNFSIDIDILTRPQIDKFFESFSPRNFELFSHGVMREVEVRNLCKSLVKISTTVQEIKYTLSDYIKDGKIREEVVLELSSTLFPNLLKISSNIYNYSDLKLKELLIYSLVGKNSPKLRHLELGNITESCLGSPEFMKEQFEQSRLMSKLQILSLFDSWSEDEFNRDLINVFTEFGQKGALKLTKLKIEDKQCLSAERFKAIFVPLIASQEETLKILEISTRPPFKRIYSDRPPFPSLQNLSILHIDYFSIFEAFEPINFGLQYPKLVEFRTRDIKTFLIKNLGQGGDLVKSVTVLKNPLEERYVFNHFIKDKLNFDQFYQIFPNLEFLELDLFNFYPSVPFRSQLKRVVIKCEIEDLFLIDRELLQDAKKVELLVDCGRGVTDNSYKVYLAGFMKFDKVEDDKISVSEYYNSRHKYKYYQQFLDRISRNFASPSISLTFIGYNIPEGFKQDLEAILPHCTFICSPFESDYWDYV